MPGWLQCQPIKTKTPSCVHRPASDSSHVTPSVPTIGRLRTPPSLLASGCGLSVPGPTSSSPTPCVRPPPRCAQASLLLLSSVALHQCPLSVVPGLLLSSAPVSFVDRAMPHRCRPGYAAPGIALCVPCPGWANNAVLRASTSGHH